MQQCSFTEENDTGKLIYALNRTATYQYRTEILQYTAGHYYRYNWFKIMHKYMLNKYKTIM